MTQSKNTKPTRKIGFKWIVWANKNKPHAPRKLCLYGKDGETSTRTLSKAECHSLAESLTQTKWEHKPEDIVRTYKIVKGKMKFVD